MVRKGGERKGKEDGGKGRYLVSHRRLAVVSNAAGVPLRRLVSGAEMVLTDRVPVVETRSKELDERLATLRRKLEERQYGEMVKDISGGKFGTEDRGGEMDMRSMQNQMSVGMNVIVTMLTCFAAGYFLVSTYFSSKQYGLLGGLAGLIIGLGVEGTLVISRVYMLDDSEMKRRKNRDKEITKNVKAKGRTISKSPPPPTGSFEEAEQQAIVRSTD